MYGAIDIGTNSVRLLIGQVEERKVKPIYRSLCTTRLGEGVQSSGRIKEEAVQRTVKALAKFKQSLQEFGVPVYRAVATSAARDADNSSLLISAAKAYGIEVEIITGQEEASLSYAGAVSVHRGLENPVVVDIGGGSTEIINLDNEGKVQTTSTNVGAVRCTEATWPESRIVQALKPALQHLPKELPLNLVGVGGTITTLAAIDQKLELYDPEKVQGYRLESKTVESILKKLEALSPEERKKVPGLRPERADIILAGIRILSVILNELSLHDLLVSESDLLDGIILALNGCTVD
jgi:exopolyphosphatase/guanosine-5'-triphosphate,3'-diphosphate pyrophosphatase